MICQIGDEIRVERDISSPEPKKKATSSKDTKSKGGKKQLSIATMFKPAPPKPNKKKQDIIVRLATMRGFGTPKFLHCDPSSS